MTYSFYCGNTKCPTRREAQPDGSIGRLFTLTAEDLDAHDGHVWLCETCEAANTRAAS